MRVFSKFVFICNLCFIVSVVLRWIESRQRGNGNFNGAIPFQPLEASIVVLGYSAILINVVFFLLAGIYYRRPFVQAISRKILLFNLVIFPIQVYYFFFLNL